MQTFKSRSIATLAAVLAIITSCGGEIPFGEDTPSSSPSAGTQAAPLDDEVAKIVSASIADAAAPGVSSSSAASGGAGGDAVQVTSSESDTADGRLRETTYILAGADTSESSDSGTVTVRRRTILPPDGYDTISSGGDDHVAPSDNTGTSGGSGTTGGDNTATGGSGEVRLTPYEASLPNVTFVPSLPSLDGPSDELYLSFNRYRRVLPDTSEVTITGDVRCVRRLNGGTVEYVCVPVSSAGDGTLTVDARRRRIAQS